VSALRLPDELRSELKDPLGPIYTDAEELLAAATTPLVSVGDVVTYHLLEAGIVPAVALVDEQTERTAVDREITERIASAAFDRRVEVSNPAATLTAALLEAMDEALERAPESTLLEVDGEEDLAALPAVALAPDGTSVVYGQPGEGMVLVRVDDELREQVCELLSRMDGDQTLLEALS